MSKVIQIKTLSNSQQMFDPKYNPSQRLWVVNTSDRGGKQRRGDVLFMVKDEDGSDIQILIPATWLPIDLTQFTNIGVFAKSTNFRTYVRNQLLVVISDETAEQLMKMPGAANERLKVDREIEMQRHAAKLSDNIGGNTVKLGINSDGVQVTAREDSELQRLSSDDMHVGNTPKARAILSKVANATAADMEIIHPDLVDFLITSTDQEIKTVAAGLSSHTSPVFAYTDVALNAIAEGVPITIDMFAQLRTQSTDPNAAMSDISFSVPN